MDELLESTGTSSNGDDLITHHESRAAKWASR